MIRPPIAAWIATWNNWRGIRSFSRSSLNLVQAVVQRYISPFLWDPIIVTILLWWAFAVLMVLGLLILALSGGRARAKAALSRRPS